MLWQKTTLNIEKRPEKQEKYCEKNIRRILDFCIKRVYYCLTSGTKWYEVVGSGETSVMFMGQYNHTIDAKGRLIIPSKFREQLGEAFVVTKGNDGCLYVYTNEAWEGFLVQLKQLPNNKNTRKLVHAFVSNADTVEIDKQGRILVNADLRAHANVEKEVVLAGAIDKIEIWDKQRWEEINSDDDLDDITEQMAELGLSI